MMINIWSIVGAVGLILFIIPLFTGSRFNTGSLLGLVLFGLLFWNGVTEYALFYRLMDLPLLLRFIPLLMLIPLIMASVCMYHASHVEAEKNATVIVLGCGVYGERPSLMLIERMDAAIAYLNENPESFAILSGGQGSGEDITEAEAMYRYMKAHGIAEERLIKEDLSTNTQENIRHSKKIIEERGLNPSVAVATNEFHEYRASLLLKEEGMSFSAISAPTIWYGFPTYCFREMIAVVARWTKLH